MIVNGDVNIIGWDVVHEFRAGSCVVGWMKAIGGMSCSLMAGLNLPLLFCETGA